MDFFKDASILCVEKEEKNSSFFFFYYCAWFFLEIKGRVIFLEYLKNELLGSLFPKDLSFIYSCLIGPLIF